MNQSIIHITVLVTDYDEAIAFYVNLLKFNLIEDTLLSDQKRWVLVQPPGLSGCCLLLAKAANARQLSSVGNPIGGRVFLFLQTDNFNCDYKEMVARGIQFVRSPKVESYGIVAVFQDLNGNLWDLIQRNS